MNNCRKWLRLAFVLVAACLTSPLAPLAGAQQEPVLVGRIAYVEGQILRYVPEIKDWVIISRDAPFGLDDALYSDASAKAEFVFPNALLVRIGASTQIQLIALKGDASEIDVASGVARFYNRNPNGMLKVTTPFGYVLAGADSTFDLYVGDQSVEVLALNGQVDYFQEGSDASYEVTSGGPSILADATQVTNGEGSVDAQWDDWNAGRDNTRTKRAEVRGESVKYVPPQLQDDAYDLDESGKWDRVNYEGKEVELWRPTAVEPNWQPFTVGRWTDYDQDQVWVPEEPFGYVTHHYGNWLLIDGAWYWAPPAPVVEVAAGPSIGFGWYPGRVAWISTDADVGWVPLAPAEVYYSHHYWGPSAVVAGTAPVMSIAIGRMAFVSAAVVVPQASFYSVTNYSPVRVTNINKTIIINNFHAAPVVNNTVVKNYNQTTAKYNFVNKAPDMKPHASVAERINRNERIASTEGKSLSAPALKRAAATAKPSQPVGKAAVPPPAKLTNKLVPPNQVNTPKAQAPFKQVDIKKNTRPATASSAAKAGGTRGPVTPGVRPRPPAPSATRPTEGGPAAARPEIQPAPRATLPPAPAVTRPQPAPKPAPAPAPRPEVREPASAPRTAPAPAQRPAPAPAPRPEVREPASAPRPAPAPAPKPAGQQQPDKKKPPGQQ